MPCDTQLRKGQTITERKTEVRAAVARLSTLLARGKVTTKIGPQGAVTFVGWDSRDGVTDACAYRRLMIEGSALARAAIAKAEQLAGRGVDRRVVGHGVHSHDGGHTWHSKG